MKEKVLITEKIAESGVDKLRKEFDVDIKLDIAKDKDAIINTIPEYSALIVRSATKVDADIIAAGKKLKIIGRAGIGVDNVDLEASTKQGVIVANAPQSNIISAAEHTLALLLSLARFIPQADASLREGRWDRNKFEGAELYGKIFGIIGFGKIGSLVAERAVAFGMSIVVYDPYISEEKARSLNVQVVKNLEDLLKTADFITVHLPKTNETMGLIGKEQLEIMKPTARIINTARGGIIDDEALTEAIKAGKIAGAGVDVYKVEPCTDSPLFGIDGTVVTPHLGASTEEAQDKAGVTIAEQVLAGLKGEFVNFAVNLSGSVDESMKPYLEIAEKLGAFFASLIDEQLNDVKIEYFGNIAESDTSLLSVAVLKGIFDRVVAEPVTYVNAPLLAKERGIKITESKSSEQSEYVNLVRVSTRQNEENISVAGTIISPNSERFVGVNDYAVDFAPEKHMAYFKYADVPGVIGHVGTVLGEEGINIGSMQVGRETIGGQAAMLITVDTQLGDELIEKIKKVANISEARAIDL